MIKKLNYKSLLLVSIFTLASFASVTYSFLTNKIWRIENATGADYLCDVEQDIKDIKAHKCVTPTDDKFSTQKSYSMNSVGDITSVWDTYTGKGKTIAIIDDGFAYNHPEYVRKDGSSAISSDSAYFYQSGSNVLTEYYKDDPSCIDEDWEGKAWATHGSNTSSTAAAPINNGGIVGIAPDATILALKIDFYFSSLKAAITYAISKNVDVISMSLGAYAETFYDGFGDKQEGSSSVATYLDTVCKNAYNAGIIVVAAAGNEGTYHHSYPACNYKVIGVGALNQNSTTVLAPFTNYNSATESGEKNVDILAPGFVYAAGAYGSSSTSYNNGYSDTQGTSFSCPIVAGAAALWKEKYPSGTPSQFLTQLQESAANIGTFKNKDVPLSLWGYTDVGPSNISDGTLDVGALMKSGDPTGITISDTTKSLSFGGGKVSDQLTATVVPATSDIQDITWHTSNESVISISSTSAKSGAAITITATGVGTATITAAVKNTTFKAECYVSVSQYVAVTGVTLLDANGQSSTTLNELNETVQLTTTILPSNATNKVYILDSSKESVATVSDSGLVTAKGNGTTTITALTEDGFFEAYYTVTVSILELVSISLSNTPTTVPYYGTLDTSKIIVTAHYNNSQYDKTVTGTFELKGDTKSIGNKTVEVSYTENNITKTASFTVFCTNVGAVREEHQSTAVSYSTGNMTSKSYVSEFDKSVNLNDKGKNWTFTTTSDSAFFDTDGNKGIHIGSSTKPCKDLAITSSDFASSFLTSIVVNTSGASKVSCTLSVTVGGVAFKCDNKNSVDITSSNAAYTFTGSAKGIVVISYNQSSSKALYLKSIAITGAGGTYYDWYGKDQAASTIAYVKTFNNYTCASSWTNRSLIKQLACEYNAMINESKLDNAWLETFTDNGYNTTAINKLITMVEQYNQTLQSGETQLSLSIPEEINSSINHFNVYAIDSNLIAIILSVVSIAVISFSVCLLFKRKIKQ